MEINGYKIGPYADLRGAGLRGTGLRGADLRGADLRGADLWYANLRYANLRGADLRGAGLRGADLRGADLQDAGLQDANLRYAGLQDANLRGADLRGADLQDANLPPLSILPEGTIVGWKKLKEGICKLEIPAYAKRVNSTGRKCRAEFAIVLTLPEDVEEGHSQHDPEFTYRVGEPIKPDRYDPDFRVECSHGIHFFITREEAENY